MTNNSRKRRAFMFTMDAFMAAVLLVSTLIVFANINVAKPSTETLEFLSRDIIETLSDINIYELRDSNDFVKDEIENGNITNFNNSVLEQIGEFWAKNKLSKAKLLAESALKGVVPPGYGFSLIIGDDVIYTIPKDSSTSSSTINTRRMISGIEKGKPIYGSTSDAYLKAVRDKPSSVYLYFGGFVGQGNITGQMFVPPVDNITMIVMELQAGADFRLFINDIPCQESTGDFIFNPSPPALGNMTADFWDISHCNTSVKKTGGLNNFSFVFSDINRAYIGGGYVKVSYRTDKFQELDYGVNVSRNYFPGIFGIVNLFDSFYIPGELRNLSMRLHYLADHTNTNYTFYVTIGNKTVYYDNSSVGDVDIMLDDRNFSMLDYSEFNSTTIPVRIGFENVTFQQIITGGEGFGDIVVTTDVSGSMNWRVDWCTANCNWGDFCPGIGSAFSACPGVNRVCNDPLLYNDSTQRLSLAKCLNKIFVEQVLENTTLNRIGLVQYHTNTHNAIDLTNDISVLHSEIDTYIPRDATCISCGLASAFTILSNAPPVQLHDDYWKFSMDYQTSGPPANWNLAGFDDSAWQEGRMSFGYNSGETTTIGSLQLYANLWENAGDTPGPPADFSSGVLNSTGNTYGLNPAGDDGWDWKIGDVYGGNSLNVAVGPLQMWGAGNYLLYQYIGGSPNMQTSAGSFGIQFNVTPEMYAVLSSGGFARFSMNYIYRDSNSANNFEPLDQVWIKARITNTTGDIVYLGSNLDAGHSGGDPENEIYTSDDPDGSVMNGFFSQIITDYITEPGAYYLDFGGKLLRDANNEVALFYFDNIEIVFVSSVGDTYYRNTFDMNSLSRFSNARLYVSSDDGADVFLNGNLISNDPGPHGSFNWNVDGIPININNFVEGQNLLAVKLYNNDVVSGFLDVELRSDMVGRQKAIVIMSDGEANRCIDSWTGISASCSSALCPDSTGAFTQPCPTIIPGYPAISQLVNVSCYLHNYHNISIYSIAFGEVSTNGRLGLQMAAACDNASHFYSSKNASGLSQIYQDIADSILTGFSTRQSQVIVVSGGGYEKSTLYPDSYIDFNYTPIVGKPETNEILLSFESEKFQNCTPQVEIPLGIRIIDSRIISYSGHHWTDFVSVNNKEVFNLSHYDSNSYIALGDPFVVNIPSNLLVPGAVNNFSLKTGDEPTINTDCSENNSLQYLGLVNASTGRTLVLPDTEGCNWTVESEDGVLVNISIPKNYMGTKQCNYTSTSIAGFNENSTYDVAVLQLLRGLDFDKDGRTLINIKQENLEINVIMLTGLPYQWGPSIVQTRLWK